MKLVVRYLLVFGVPLLASMLLFYGSIPLRAEAHHISNEWLSLALSSHEQDNGAAFAALGKDEHTKIFRKIEHLAIFTILLASFICALIIPHNLSSERKLNLLTAMVVGLCFTEFAIGFGLLNWLDFGKAAAAGSVLAGSVVWLRSAVMRKQTR